MYIPSSAICRRIDETDVVRVEPTERGLDYAVITYAIGSALIQAIGEVQNDAASYLEIKPVEVNTLITTGLS